MALAYFVGSVVQGSADAFAEAEIATALSGQTGRACRVREIVFEWSATTAANGATFEACLSRRSQASMPNVTDRNVIVKSKRTATLTTSGATIQSLTERFAFSEDDEVLVVEDPLYLEVDSGSTSLTLTLYCRIGYELVNISANDRLQLALQSLNEST